MQRIPKMLVPVVKNADRKAVFEISDEINSLATKAREGKLAPAEMKGASCTITNIGSANGSHRLSTTQRLRFSVSYC